MRYAAILMSVALMASFSAHSAVVTVESDAKLSEGVSRDLAVKLAQYIALNGYSCNSVSAVTPFAFSRGYHVFCNNWQYEYEIADKGGRLIVTVK